MFKKGKHKITAIIVAAGNGTRMGTDIKKQFIEINGVPVIIHTLRVFEAAEMIDDVLVVTAEKDISLMLELIKTNGLKKVKNIVSGGETRSKSVINGLKYAENSDYVVIHDGARPCVKVSDVEKTVQKAIETGAAFLGVRVTDTIKEVDETGSVVKTVDRTPLWRVQTPQCFKTSLITEAYEKFENQPLTDDAMAVEMLGEKVYAVEGDSSNIKITTKSDILIAQGLL